MSDGTKSNHMKKVFCQKPIKVSENSQSLICDLPVLSVPVDECEITSVSQSTLRSIWSKAEQLIRSEGTSIWSKAEQLIRSEGTSSKFHGSVMIWPD